MVGLEVYLYLALLFVEDERRYDSGAECTLDEELDVGSIVDDVDVLVAEFAYDTMDTRSLDAYACTYGVDAVVV